MKTLAHLDVALALAWLCVCPAPASAQDAVSQAKAFYDSASYTEALSALNEAGSSADVVEVEKYRALCLLALGRQKDAEQSLEHLAMARPLFTLEGSDASPKLVALFQDVSKRTLPEAAKQIYQRGRTSFDQGDMAEASRQFKDVIALADQAPPEHAALMGDLKMLAVGFARLTEASAAKPSPPAPSNGTVGTAGALAATSRAPSAVEPAAAVKTTPAGSVRNPAASGRIYSAADTDVRPPVAVERVVPPWQYRPEAFASIAFEGRLEAAVDEQGNVVDATMVRSINASYDRILVAAARKWRFQPATLEGNPVKYRLMYQFTVPPARPK